VFAVAMLVTWVGTTLCMPHCPRTSLGLLKPRRDLDGTGLFGGLGGYSDNNFGKS